MSELGGLPSDVKEAAKAYLSEKEIPQLFESLTAGLLHHKPEDPAHFLQLCLAKLREHPGKIHWDTFVEWTPSSEDLRKQAPSSWRHTEENTWRHTVQ